MMTKQESAIKYIIENYLQHNRLRHDLVADKIQIRITDSLSAPHNTTSVIGNPAEDASLQYAPKGLPFRGTEYWRELSKHDINSIVCHAAQEYDQNITSREVMTALQSDLIPQVHPLREYIRSLPAWKPESGDWIDWVARQVRVKGNDNEENVYKEDNTDNLRPNQYPLGAQGKDKIQQPKQLDSTTIPKHPIRPRGSSGTPLLANTASGEGDDFNDNIDNLRPNQYPLGAQGKDKIQQPKQLDSTTIPKHPIRPRGSSGTPLLANTASGEGDDFNDNIDNLRPNQYPLGAQGEDTPSADCLWRVCFKKWFVAMVASWMKDDVVNHQVLVLIGKQGIYKTTWLEHLIPPHLRSYACKLANSSDLNKDERLRIAEFGLISLDEIDSMNNRELNQLKSVITASDVNERAAYAYTKERRIRLASFCASGNRRDFLTDITGNRRWLPFEVESIQNPFFTTLPYDLMYAQAWALANDPTFCYWFELDEIEVLEQHNQHFRDESNEEQLLPILFDVPAEGRGEFMTTAQISERLATYGNIKRPMSLGRLGMLLGQHGYQSVRPRIGGVKTRGWLVYQRDTDGLNALKRLYKDT